MDEIIQVHDVFYILATSSRIDEHSRVLKHGDTFALQDRFGNIHRLGMGEQGLYHEGTRHLSRLELRVQGRRPSLLGSTLREDNVLVVDLTNPDFSDGAQVVLPRDSIHISRSSFIWNGTRHERLRFRNYLLRPVVVSFSLLYEADFADIFEVRGVKRPRRGEMLETEVEPGRVRLSYRGLDGVERGTTIRFNPQPAETLAGRAEFICELPAHADTSFDVAVACGPAAEPESPRFDHALDAAGEELHRSRGADADIWSSSEQFNDWLNRSISDLHVMFTRTPDGPYPYAGVPWFSTFFGRDGIITALEYLWVNPEPARAVLAYLARHQATSVNENRDAEPGKIVHETRRGEMAALGEIPFDCYYGSVDATPLFVILAGAYYERTADRDFIHSIWRNIDAALEWIDRYGDVDGDGFVDYVRRCPQGLVVQGWRDSVDSTFHAEGDLAEGAVALGEVQAYVFAAKRAAADLAGQLGDPRRAERLLEEAERLRSRFEEFFWCDELSTYALALDGRHRPCRVRSSTAGHALFAGIASPARAARVADTLLGAASFSGWGVRTIAAGEARYNPMSYHNGSVWPHDNALIAAGLARYGLASHAMRLFNGLLGASLYVDLHRMPELFCGFQRRPGEGPILYPVACAPQSWAAAAAPYLLQSLLGLTIDAPRAQVRFDRPVLPPSITHLRIRNLRIGEAVVDFDLERYHAGVRVDLVRRTGQVEILIRK